MLKNNVKVVLHGHGHQPFIGRESRIYDNKFLKKHQRIGEERYLYVIGCGSTGAKLQKCGAVGMNVYNLYTLFDSGHMRIEVRRLMQDGSDGQVYRSGRTALPVTTPLTT